MASLIPLNYNLINKTNPTNYISNAIWYGILNDRCGVNLIEFAGVTHICCRRMYVHTHTHTHTHTHANIYTHINKQTHMYMN